MKSALHLHSFFFAALCLSSILHFQSLASEEPQNATKMALLREDLEAVRSACQQDLSDIDQCLSDTIQIVNSGVISIDNLDEKLTMLVDIRLTVSSLLQKVRNVTVITPDGLNRYLDIIEKLSLHITTTLSDLNNIKPFEYVAHKSVSIDKEEISLQELRQMTDYNNDIVEEVISKQSKLGLSGYNRVFRKMDAFCSEHYDKFDVALKAGTVSVAALALLYGYYPLNILFGPSPEYHNDMLINGLNDKLLNPRDLPLVGKLGAAQHSLRDLTSSSFYSFAWPILSSAAGALYWMGFKNLKKKFFIARNRLKGGIYKNLTIESYEDHRMSSNVTFDDIVGLEHAKQQLREVIEFIKNPEQYARNGSIPSKGILLYGPPGTGKTHIVEAMEGEMKKALAEVDKEVKVYRWEAHDIIKHGMKAIIDYMEQKAPCVIFIDELDMLGLQRTGKADLLANFLEAMSSMVDGRISMDLEKQVFVIAATNQVDNLDKALLRPGRFGKRIAFEVPTVRQRFDYLQKRLSNLFVDMSLFDLDKTAQVTYGCIYEHLNMAIKAATRKAKDDARPMDQSLLDEMIDTEIRGIVFEQVKSLPLNEIQVIAAHHLGRVIAGILYKSRYVFDKVTLYPVAIDKEERAVWDRFYNAKENKEKDLVIGGVFTYPLGDSLDISTARDQEIKIKELLSGHVAEHVLIGSSSYAYAPLNNRDRALKLALTQVSKGINIKSYSEDAANKLRDQAHELINSYETELTELFTTYKNRMTLMVHTLIFSKELTENDILTLINVDEEVAGTLIQDQRRIELVEALVEIERLTPSNVIFWLTMPQEEFDEIFDTLTKQVAEAEATEQQAIAGEFETILE